MSRPKFVQAKKTTISATLSSASLDVVLKELKDLYGTELSMTDFGDAGYVTIDPGLSTEEIISFTGFTRATDGKVTLSGVTRALVGVSPYAAGGVASTHNAGSIVVISNNPQLYEAILDYIDGVAIAGGADASYTGKGFLERATTAEIDADTANGSTGAPLAINPFDLSTSIYRTQLPTATEKAFLGAATGSITAFAGEALPTGFLDCDGALVSNETYSDLLAVILGKYGLDVGTVFTVDDTTDIFTSNNHGLANGNRVLVSSTTTLPTGISTNTIYFVINSTTNTFQLSTSSGGSAVDLSSTGSGEHQFHITFRLPDLRGSVIVGKGQKSVEISFESDDITVTTVGTVSDTTASNDRIDFLSAHGLTTGDSIIFDTAFGGVSADTVYYVEVADTDTVILHTTRDSASPRLNEGTGTPVNVTTDSLSGAVAYKVGSYTVKQPLPGIYQTGSEVVLATTGTLPAGLSAGTYYFVRVDDYNFQLAANIIDAATFSEGVAIGDVGSGSHTLTLTLSSRSVGDSGGEEEHQLMESELAEHDHNTYADGADVDRTDSGGGNSSEGNNTAGGDQAHENMPPFVVANWIIKT